MICKAFLTTALAALICAPAFADDLTPKIAAQPVTPNAEIHISWISPASDLEGRAIEVACGEVTVRNPRGFDTSTVVYIIDDDKVLVAWQEQWMREPDPQGYRKVMRYCPGR